jgi:hypothetical protein
MKRSIRYAFSIFATMAISGFFSLGQSRAANLVVWEPANSLVDTTNYTGLAPYHWFANFQDPNNLAPATGAPMDQNEARNLPSWIHLESRPGCIGKADDCTTSDSAPRTGFSFVESGAVGDTSTGGQTSFNTLTLPNGNVGKSGQAVESLSVVNNTSNELFMRMTAGAPSSFRIWVVTDSGSGANYNVQSRIRVSLRDTNGPPDYTGDIGQFEAEALPGAKRLIESGSSPTANNGVADAWSFLLSDVNVNDIVTIRPTSSGGTLPAFAGIIIQEVVPEPCSLVLLLTGVCGVLGLTHRRR